MMEIQNDDGIIYESMVVINIPDPVSKLIHDIKTNFGEKYNSTHGKQSIPYITLFDFTQSKSYVNQINDTFKPLCDKQHKFKIELLNYGFFPRHTTYVAVQKNPEIKKLGEKLMRALEQGKLSDKIISSFNKSHVTISRSLNTDQYNQAFSEYSKKKFQASFIADSITLLTKRSPADPKNFRWKNKYFFPFGKEQLEAVKELSLFN